MKRRCSIRTVSVVWRRASNSQITVGFLVLLLWRFVRFYFMNVFAFQSHLVVCNKRDLIWHLKTSQCVYAESYVILLALLHTFANLPHSVPLLEIWWTFLITFCNFFHVLTFKNCFLTFLHLWFEVSTTNMHRSCHWAVTSSITFRLHQVKISYGNLLTFSVFRFHKVVKQH